MATPSRDVRAYLGSARDLLGNALGAEYLGRGLCMTAFFGNEGLVQHFLEIGANINAEWMAQSPRGWAFEGGHETLAARLINCGALVDVQGRLGKTPLILATERRWVRLVVFLLHRGAQPNTRDFSGRTPLSIATALAHLQLMELLVRKRADVTVKSHCGTTPLHEFAKMRQIDFFEAVSGNLYRGRQHYELIW
jgi:ankyrin repeat protein